jgi:hypothetical protein
MEINITTPALLFPAISLLMLAYTNRFLALAALIRSLHATYKTEPSENIVAQLRNLRYRVRLIRNMQGLGALCALLAAVCMFLLFEGWLLAGKVFFVLSLGALIGSLALSLREIMLSGLSLDLQLQDIEDALR